MGVQYVLLGVFSALVACCHAYSINNEFRDDLETFSGILKSSLKGSHHYYNSTVIHSPATRFWIDSLLQDDILLYQSAKTRLIQKGTIGGSEGEKSRRVELHSFKFPFLGRSVTQLDIAFDGFLRLAPRDEVVPGQDLELGRDYIAPLANKFNSGQVSYYEISLPVEDSLEFYSELVVAWKGMGSNKSGGNATDFVAVVKQSGAIDFMYRRVDGEIFKQASQSVTVGISALLVPANQTTAKFQPSHQINMRRYLTETHKTILRDEIVGDTVILWDPIPTCQQRSNSTCQVCTDRSTPVAGTCYWCEETKLCSNGMDFNLGVWKEGGCHETARSACKVRRDAGDDDEDDDDEDDDDDSDEDKQELKAPVIVREKYDYYEKEVHQNVDHTYQKYYTELSLDDDDVREYSTLSEHSKGASRHTFTKFQFFFYGHQLSEVYATTEGFLSVAPALHPHMDKLQYIAPLSLDFDLSKSDQAKILWRETEEKTTIEWRNVTLAARDGDVGSSEEDESDSADDDKADQSFTFQVNLLANGDIAFVYVKIPEKLNLTKVKHSQSSDWSNLNQTSVGLSEAFMRRGFLHEFSKIHVELDKIHAGTVVLFRALPTCHHLLPPEPASARSPSDTCRVCLGRQDVANRFNCSWCPSAGSCSSGVDRKRGDWESLDCHVSNISLTSKCDSSDSVESEMYRVEFVTDAGEMWFQSEDFVASAQDLNVVSLPFLLPYFRTRVERVFVWRGNGVLSLDDERTRSIRRPRRIAPLRGPSSGFEGATTEYFRGEDRVTVKWSNLRMGGVNQTAEAQVSLFPSGDLEFVYRSLPPEWFSPLADSRVGLTHPAIFISQKTEVDVRGRNQRLNPNHPLLDILAGIHGLYYEIHKLDLSDAFGPFLSGPEGTTAAIRFNMKPSCIQQKNCSQCLAFSGECSWCPGESLCTRTQDLPKLPSDVDTCSSDLDTCQQKLESTEEEQTETVKDHKYYTSKISPPVEVSPSSSSMSGFLPMKPYLPYAMSFDFPFYGVTADSVTASEKGFLFFDTKSKLKPPKQYVAPIMADFKTNDLDPSSHLLVRYSNVSVTVRWSNMELQSEQGIGNFTFQATLFVNGSILFEYIDVPPNLQNIRTRAGRFSLIVGLSDASTQQILIANVTKVYHIISLSSDLDKIKSGTTIEFTPLPSCPQMKTCWECLTQKTEFQCLWSMLLNICWDKIDRNRHNWPYGFHRELSLFEGKQAFCQPEIVESEHESYTKSLFTNAQFAPAFEEGEFAEIGSADATLEIPFRFWFFGQTFRNFKAFREGFLLLLRGDDDGLSEVAPLKSLLRRRPSGQQRMFLASSHESVFVRWRSARDEFHARLFPNSSVEFYYVKVDLARLMANDSDGDYSVGLFREPDGRSGQGKQVQIQQMKISPKDVRKNLRIRFDPIPCSDGEAASASCLPRDLSAPQPATAAEAARDGGDSGDGSDADPSSSSPAAGAITGIVLLLLLLLALALVARHGYKHPASFPGQAMVRMRLWFHRMSTTNPGFLLSNRSMDNIDNIN